MPARKGAQPARTVDLLSRKEPSTSPQTAPTLESADPSQDETGSEPVSSEKMGTLPQVTGIRHWASADSSTVVIDLQDQVQYEAHRLTKPERIYFDLHDTRLADALNLKTIEVGDPLLQKIRVAQPVAGVTRVVLETSGASNFSVSLEPNPYRLVVEVRKIGAKPQDRTKLDLFGPSNEAPAMQNTAAASGFDGNGCAAAAGECAQASHCAGCRSRWLGPGHGGTQRIAGEEIWRSTLWRVSASWRKSDWERKSSTPVRGDDYVALEKRAEIANLSHADLFMSVHANYSDFPSARGVETYYTNTYSSVRARPRDAGETNQGCRMSIGPKLIFVKRYTNRGVLRPACSTPCMVSWKRRTPACATAE